MKERPKGDPRFHRELARAGDLHDLKQEGYGTGEDPFANYHAVDRHGMTPSQYVVGRIEEKLQRVSSALTGPSPVDVIEELRDIGVMAFIAVVLRGEETPGQGT